MYGLVWTQKTHDPAGVLVSDFNAAVFSVFVEKLLQKEVGTITSRIKDKVYMLCYGYSYWF